MSCGFPGGARWQSEVRCKRLGWTRIWIEADSEEIIPHDEEDVPWHIQPLITDVRHLSVHFVSPLLIVLLIEQPIGDWVARLARLRGNFVVDIPIQLGDILADDAKCKRKRE